MLDAGKDAAPVSAIESLVNDSADFNIDSVATEDFVVYPAQQFQDEAPIVNIRIWMGTRKPRERLILQTKTIFVTSPSFGLVFEHLLPMPFVIHCGTPDTADSRMGQDA